MLRSNPMESRRHMDSSTWNRYVHLKLVLSEKPGCNPIALSTNCRKPSRHSVPSTSRLPPWSKAWVTREYQRQSLVGLVSESSMIDTYGGVQLGGSDLVHTQTSAPVSSFTILKRMNKWDDSVLSGLWNLTGTHADCAHYSPQLFHSCTELAVGTFSVPGLNTYFLLWVVLPFCQTLLIIVLWCFWIKWVRCEQMERIL